MEELDDCGLTESVHWNDTCLQSLHPTFESRYLRTSLVYYVVFAIIFIINLKNAIAGCLKKSRGNMSQGASWPPLFTALACFFKVLSLSNYDGIRYEEFTCAPLVAADLSTGLFILCMYTVLITTVSRVDSLYDDTMKARQVEGGDGAIPNNSKNRVSTNAEYERELKRRIAVRGKLARRFIGLSTTVLVLSNAILSSLIMCSYASHDRVVRAALMIRHCTYCCLSLYFALEGYRVSFKCHNVVKMFEASKNKMQATVNQQGNTDEQKWRGLRRRYVMYTAWLATMTVWFMIFALSVVATAANRLNKINPSDFGDSISGILGKDQRSIWTIVTLTFFGVLYHEDIEKLKKWKPSDGKQTKNRAALLWLYVSVFSSVGCVFAVPLIYNSIGVALALSVLYYTILSYCSVYLIFEADWSRHFEIDACSKYIKKERPTYSNICLILLEQGFLSFVAFDKRFLWWVSSALQPTAVLLFNTVSMESGPVVDWIRNAFHAASAETISYSMYSFVILLLITLLSTQAVTFPRFFIKIINNLCFILYDVALMQTVGFMTQRINCYEMAGVDTVMVSQGTTSLFFNGTLVGSEFVSCNNGYAHIQSVIFSVIVISSHVIIGFYYVTFVRNIAQSPRVMDVPAFSGVRLLMKVMITITISYTSDHSPLSQWIRCASNCLCVLVLAAVTLFTSPVLGPSSRFYNNLRFIGYTTAFGFNLASLVSLICFQVDSASYLSSTVAAVAYAIIPLSFFLAAFLFATKSKKWGHFDDIEELKMVCDAVINSDNGDYDHKVKLALQRGSRPGYSAFLLMLYSNNFVDKLKEHMDALQRDLHNRLETAKTSSSVPVDYDVILDAFQCISAATATDVGVRYVRRHFLDTMACLVGLTSRILQEEVNKALQNADSNSRRRSIDSTVKFLSQLIQRFSDIIHPALLYSKFYLRDTVKRHPLMKEHLVALINNMTYCIMVSGGDVLSADFEERICSNHEIGLLTLLKSIRGKISVDAVDEGSGEGYMSASFSQMGLRTKMGSPVSEGHSQMGLRTKMGSPKSEGQRSTIATSRKKHPARSMKNLTYELNLRVPDARRRKLIESFITGVGEEEEEERGGEGIVEKGKVGGSSTRSAASPSSKSVDTSASSKILKGGFGKKAVVSSSADGVKIIDANVGLTSVRSEDSTYTVGDAVFRSVILESLTPVGASLTYSLINGCIIVMDAAASPPVEEEVVKPPSLTGRAITALAGECVRPTTVKHIVKAVFEKVKDVQRRAKDRFQDPGICLFIQVGVYGLTLAEGAAVSNMLQQLKQYQPTEPATVKEVGSGPKKILENTKVAPAELILDGQSPADLAQDLKDMGWDNQSDLKVWKKITVGVVSLSDYSEDLSSPSRLPDHFKGSLRLLTKTLEDVIVDYNSKRAIWTSNGLGDV